MRFRNKEKTDRITIYQMIADAMASGKLTSVYEMFGSEYDQYWFRKGDHVRGQFHLMIMGGPWFESDLKAAMKREAKILGKTLFLATAYEAVNYVANGWNGTDCVVAFGSSCSSPEHIYFYPYLWSAEGNRRLRFLQDGQGWNKSTLVLCVCK